MRISALSIFPEESAFPTVLIRSPMTSAVIGEGVRKVYEEILVPAGMGDVAIYTELGRFMLGALRRALVTKAIHEKHTYKEYIGVDACAVNLMRPGHVRRLPSYHRDGQGGRALRP